ncbi:4'-phosphopantetheinyl transferase family protein [Paenarthrobacter sp. NPDC090520]|uniref:4'-phosphopantetheinyl transferase family protein n=1 Tax=Paenarthrobacter sp. NPDC090520 TaxID=3364382 RepID=UPI003801A46D
MTSGTAAQAWISWAAPLEDAAESAYLSTAERGQVATKRRHEDRVRSASARLILKAVLKGQFGIDPAGVELVASSRAAKPVLHVGGAPSRLRANISHAGDVVMVAVTEGIDVGVDVEHEEATAFPDFDAVALSDAERAALHALPRERWPGTRAGYWVRKEALVKATGTGLSVDPRTICFESPGPVMPPSIVRLELGRGYAAALCIPGASCIDLRHVAVDLNLPPRERP